MIDPEQIPPEVVEAAARALCLHPDLIVDNHTPICPGPAWRLYVEDARAAIVATLNAWPNAKTLRDDGRRQTYIVPALILPLTQEARDV